MSTELYNATALECSRVVTRAYSTSFSLAIRSLSKPLRNPVYAIYGFVRFADEIVDSFHDTNQDELLADFRAQTLAAIRNGFSSNPILHAFQAVVNRYAIPIDLVEAFLHSMRMDLAPLHYDRARYEEYIYGSAEVVGLMCLCVFCDGNPQQYERLKPAARRLGAAFQKINFLRDLRADVQQLGRLYFPDVDLAHWNAEQKARIEQDIEADFDAALEGIRQLPEGCRWGVFLAYRYYRKLFAKIRHLPPAEVMERRVRISNGRKLQLLMSGYLQYQLRLL